MGIQAYLVFNGNAGEAIAFYETVFESTAKVMTFGQAPGNPDQPMPEEVKNRVIHGDLPVAGTSILFSDTFPGMPYAVGNNVTVMLAHEDGDVITKYFEALAVGGRVNMPLQETFFSAKYGQVTDKFGVVWQLNNLKTH